MPGSIPDSIHKNGKIERNNSIATENTLRVVSDNTSVSMETKEETIKDEQALENQIIPKTSSPVWMFWKKDDLESDPRQFSTLKKRLILLTVAFATST
jgi:hypothetical protein